VSAPSFRTEAEFQSAVCELARKLGCLVFHPKNVRRSEPGFPDLVIAGNRAFLFRELKTNEGRLRPEQADWIAKLTAAKADVGVWRPSDWDRVVAELKAIA
jgi:hypothetical protein